MQNQLCNKFLQEVNNLDRLVNLHKHNQQNVFLSTYRNIMEKIVGQLNEFKRKFEEVDLDIRKEPVYQRIEQELMFFRDECLHLTEENQKLLGENQSLKNSFKRSEASRISSHQRGFRLSRKIQRVLKQRGVYGQSMNKTVLEDLKRPVCNNCQERNIKTLRLKI